jgi:hypothetical protein
MNKLPAISCVVLLFCCLVSCCRDCDSIVIPPAFSNTLALDYSRSSLSFIDTTWHDTTQVAQLSFEQAVNTPSKKQFPLDCEECGTEYARASFSGFRIVDTAIKKFTYYSELSAGNDTYTIKDSTGHLMFIARDIRSAPRLDSLIVNGRRYSNVIVLTTLSCSQDSSLSYCKSTVPYFTKLYFAPAIGLIRYEAVNHPQHGTVIYDRLR